MSSARARLMGPLPHVGRLEDRRLVVGAGRFVSDMTIPGTLHARFVRSTVAHGTIVAVDTRAARSVDGVVAVFVADDLDLADIPGSTDPDAPSVSMRRPPLARDRVRFCGEPIAIVVARDESVAIDAAELVDVDILSSPAIDVDRALGGDALLFPAAGTNVVAGSVAGRVPSPAEVADGAVVVEVAVEEQRLAPVTLEPLSILVSPEPSGLVVWCGNQAPHRLGRQLAQMLRCDPAALRVRSPDVGGSFGLRGRLHPEYGAVAAAARELGRPVRWIQQRAEQFLAGTHGRAMRHHVRLVGDREGRLRAVDVDILADVGAYPHNGAHLPRFSALMATGVYDIPEVCVRTRVVVTNRAPVGSYRGAGRPEATFAVERAIDRFAAVAGLDPSDVRRRNLIPSSALPTRTAGGAVYDSGDYRRVLELALDRIDEPAVRREQRRRRADGGRLLGVATVLYVERAGGPADSSEQAVAELDPAGRVVVRAGSASTGQGHETVWAQLAARTFGVEPRDVTVLTGDVDAVPTGTGSFGSRSAQVGGSAVHLACQALRAEVLRCAADQLGAKPSDLRLRGGLVEEPRRARSLTLATLASRAARAGRRLRCEETYSPGAQTFPYGAVSAVVEVDPETGLVRLDRLVLVDDSGVVLNPQIAEGQLHGSLAQGAAQALHEQVVYDEVGQVRNASLGDYHVPGAGDLPAFETASITTPAPSNPLGVKGVGEAGCLGAPPAIVNAAIDALAHLGVTDLQMPLTPLRVWEAIRAASRTPAAGSDARGPRGAPARDARENEAVVVR